MIIFLTRKNGGLIATLSGFYTICFDNLWVFYFKVLISSTKLLSFLSVLKRINK